MIGAHTVGDTPLHQLTCLMLCRASSAMLNKQCGGTRPAAVKRRIGAISGDTRKAELRGARACAECRARPSQVVYDSNGQ